MERILLRAGHECSQNPNRKPNYFLSFLCFSPRPPPPLLLSLSVSHFWPCADHIRLCLGKAFQLDLSLSKLRNSSLVVNFHFSILLEDLICVIFHCTMYSLWFNLLYSGSWTVTSERALCSGCVCLKVYRHALHLFDKIPLRTLLLFLFLITAGACALLVYSPCDKYFSEQSETHFDKMWIKF